MGSIKFTLKREARNEINNYIDNEFINETIKEIVLYINNVHKASVDDSNYDEFDLNSRIKLKDNGSFNVYDYILVKDFYNEISWEGSYVECESEVDEHADDRITYKYEPIDVCHVIYEKVIENMENKKGAIYKAFKKQYNEEFLFGSVKWYKRTRDGKEYYNMDLEEINPDKKRSLEERIKTEIGNAFKSRWGSSIVSKVSPLDDELLLDVYDKGCRLLDIKNEYEAELVQEENSIDEENLVKVFIDTISDVNFSASGINRLKMKVINSLDKRIEHLKVMNIYKTNEHMNLFLEDARKLVLGYYRSLNLKGVKSFLRSREEGIINIIRRIAVVENYLYKEYCTANEKAPSIDDMIDFKECIPWMCLKGLIWTSENIYIKNKAKDEISEILLDDPLDEYPEARLMKRHFILHVGETNTGKTYSSIQRLMEVQSGVYLAPLRLLALEIQDKLNSENVPCSLLTGEEEDIIPYAQHVASTIEKLQTGMEYDVCVIDEAQMISDNQRGWAWTRAIISVLAPEIHVCMAPEALDIIIKLIEECNDTYEVVNHKRDTELIFEDKPFDLDRDVKSGDALVVFGKRKALAVCAELLNKNIKTSVIYGSLPYSTRKKQFDRFLSGETEVIVCTDAIGMGVNLPIKRIVFLETRKYDGVSLRRLNISEIKQIAGRAGRKGIYNKGYVAAANDRNLISGALKARSEKIKKCFIGIPQSLLDINIDIVDSLKTWSSMNTKGYYEKTDVTRIIFLLNRIKKMNLDISKQDSLKMATIPFEENNKEVFALWEEYCKMYSKGAINLRKPILKKNVSSKKELDNLESYYKSLDLNYSFGKNFNMMINNKYIHSEKENIANSINNLLLTSLLDHERRCSVCGKKLSWDYPNDVCRKCREAMQEVKRERYKPVFKGRRHRSSGRGKRRRNFA